MRLLHALVGLTKIDAHRRSFWGLTIVTFLMAFVFVLLHVLTDQSAVELRPILSERATVTHFDTRHAIWGIEDGIAELFRTPDAELSDESPLSSIFGFERASHLQPFRSGNATWVKSIRGNLFEVHRMLLPLLMTIIGVLAAPSARRSALLRTMMPCGRWGGYGLVIVALATRVALLSLAAAVGALILLPWLRESAVASLGFLSGYCGAIFAYGFGFALFGFTVGGIVRDRRLGALVAIAALLVVAPWVALAQGRIDAWISQAASGFLALQSPSHPLYWVRKAILIPTETTFGWITQVMLARTMEGQVASGLQAVATGHLWFRFALFIGWWAVLGGAVFPHSVRRTP